jgi:hypothetical protein
LSSDTPPWAARQHHSVAISFIEDESHWKSRSYPSVKPPRFTNHRFGPKGRVKQLTVNNPIQHDFCFCDLSQDIFPFGPPYIALGLFIPHSQELVNGIDQVAYAFETSLAHTVGRQKSGRFRFPWCVLLARVIAADEESSISKLVRKLIQIPKWNQHDQQDFDEAAYGGGEIQDSSGGGALLRRAAHSRCRSCTASAPDFGSFDPYKGQMELYLLWLDQQERRVEHKDSAQGTEGKRGRSKPAEFTAASPL